MLTIILAFYIFSYSGSIYIFLYIIKIGKSNKLAFLPYNILLYLYSLLNILFILSYNLLLIGYIL